MPRGDRRYVGSTLMAEDIALHEARAILMGDGPRTEGDRASKSRHLRLIGNQTSVAQKAPRLVLKGYRALRASIGGRCPRAACPVRSRSSRGAAD
jgi:hypothetical protein